jgi:hypothetical protein
MKHSFEVEYRLCPEHSKYTTQCHRCANKLRHVSRHVIESVPPDSTRNLLSLFYNGPGRYRVTYYTHPRGRFVIESGGSYQRTRFVKDPGLTGPSWQNCLLPIGFIGHRFDRKQKFLGPVKPS